jgi:hypothetical protein
VVGSPLRKRPGERGNFLNTASSANNYKKKEQL